MSRHTWQPPLPIGSRRRLIVALSVTLSALLSLAAPPVHAQVWGGSVEVDTGSVDVPLGGANSYRIRLSEPPTQDGWWIILRVDGGMRADGEHKGIRWVPSVGWEFNRDNWDTWREIRIYGEADTGETITFEHEVWDHESNCPFKGSPVTVQVSDDPGPNDQLPVLAIADIEVEEGRTAQFEVTLTGPRTGSVSVAFATADVTADAGDDYTSNSGTLTFGTNESSKTIPVPTIDDDEEEQTEFFTVTLSSPSGATIQDGTATGAITDNDETVTTLPTLSITGDTVEEGEEAEFTVTLTGPRTGSVSVAFATADVTADAGDDYTSNSGTLTFGTGESSKTIPVFTIDDNDEEQTETFSVSLSSPSGATIQDGTATGTITDNDETVTTLPTLSITGDTVEEGEEAEFTVTLTGPRTGSVSVAFATADVTADAGDDYTSNSGTLTFGTGESSKTIPVFTIDDNDEEQTETFSVSLSSPSGATIQDGTATGTITDNDETVTTLPTLSITGDTVEEGEEAEFTVTLTGPRTGSVSVAFATADVTADAGDDYTSNSGTLTFGTNESSKTIPVPTIDDDEEEQTEFFSVSLSSPSGATIQDGTATGAITDNDETVTTLPTLSITGDTVEEGEEAEFTVTLTGPRTGSVSVAFATADVTADAGDDYTSNSGTLTFGTNESSKTIPVPTIDDDEEEQTEFFSVSLSSPGGATIQDGTATGAITDNDETVTTLPTLSITGDTVEEGEEAEFTVTLTGPRTGSVSVAFATADVTADAGDDYTSNSGTLTFGTGESSKTIPVFTIDDNDEEQTETFSVSLSSPSGATIQDGTATGTITDNDETATTLPTLSITGDTVEEGEEAEFTVTLTGPRTGSVSVAFATADVTADAGDDYTSNSGTLTFGTNESSKTIPVPTIDDDEEEQTEFFSVSLSSPSGATIQDGTATGAITDNDETVTTLPTLSITGDTVEEGEEAEFTVTLTGPRTGSVSVAFATADVTADAGDDYTSNSGTLTFGTGESSKTIPVFTIDDNDEEQTETFSVSLSSPSGATIQDGTATGTITDDDGPVTTLPLLNIVDDTVEEGDEAEFLVTLSRTSTETVTVDYATADGTATAGDDFTATSRTLTFAPGEVSKTVPVPTVEDTTQEQTETFTVTLSSPSGATIEDGSATGTITDDDGPVTALPTLNIADDTVEEGDEAEFLVTLSRTSTETVTVDYATADGTATAGDDFTATSRTLTFAPGEASKTVRVPTVEDTTQEQTETFTVTLSSPSGATIEDGSATGTITDDDGPVTALPTLNIADDTVEEGDEAEFLVTLSRTSTETVTIDYATADGTATAGDDFTATSRTLTFAPGEASKTVRVPTVEDTTQEQTETFTVTLSSPSGATIEDGSATGTITDDDGPVTTLPLLNIADDTVEEGDEAEFLVTLSRTSTETVTVDYATADGTATAGDDFTATSRTLTFAPGEASKTVRVPTVEDTTQEQTETFTVTLSSPSGATIEDGSATGTITDDDGPVTTLPLLNIADDTVEEGEEAQFLVTLSRTSTETVTVTYTTADGTATAVADYTSASATLTFAPGEASKTIRVPTVEDTTEEQTETFTVTLSNPSGATIQDGDATGTITDDDGPVTTLPLLNIADDTVEEGEEAQFLVTLSRTSTETVTVTYTTADGTATAVADYTSASATLTFAPGEASKTIRVPTVEDTAEEQTETFTVTLGNPSGATIQDGDATGTITDDDGPVTTLPLLNIADDTVEEGEEAQFLVTLSRTSTQTVTVNYATADGTATAGDDYAAASGTLRFAPGEASKTIPVPTVEDTTEEQTETFTVTLGSPSGATIQDGDATGTITDDDGPVTTLPLLNIADDTVEEGEEAQFLVTLSRTSTETVTVNYATADGTATAGDDYAAASGTLRFAPGEASKTIPVPTVEDTTQEQTETFTVTLSSPSGATIQDGNATGTITDDDGPVTALPLLNIADDTVEEGEEAQFLVTLSRTSTQTVTVNYTTADGTATAGDDYAAASGTLRFAPGEASKTIPVPTVEDTTEEQTETFTVTLGNPSGATIQDGDATGTITDDDGPVTTLPLLNIADDTVEEGEEAQFLVTLSRTSTQTVTVNYATADGTATAGDDYAAASGTLRFAPGEASKTIPVPTVEDTTQEQTETFTVTLGNPSGATIQDGDATGTITDDDGPVTTLPLLNIADDTVEEGEEAQFLVTLSRTSTETVTVNYATADGTATAGDDYAAASGTLRFAPGEASKTIPVPTVEDTTQEQTETFTVTLGNPSGATIQDGDATGTITDDDGPVTTLPLLNIADDTVEEGEEAQFLVTLSRTSTETVTVNYTTADGTATAVADYTSASATLTFAPGEASKTIRVPTVEDTTEEQTETFTVTLSNPSGATIQDGDATGTITDDDGPVTTLPLLNIADDTVEEGEEAQFLVTLSRTSTQTVTVNYTTADGTATAVADYTSASATLTFAPGEASKTIRVPTVEDTAEEQTETFTVTLGNPSGATIQDGDATGTITDDDGPVTTLPLLNIADDTVEEGDEAQFLVTLSRTSTETVTVTYTTADGTATAVADYTSASATLTFAPGEASKTIRVPTVEDTAEEQTETFTVTLGNPGGATIQDGDATGTITDDDGPVTTLPLLNIADDTVEEGEEAQFLVTLSRTSTETVTVNYATADGTATAGDDYAAASGTLRFAPGEASKTIPVPTVEDTTEEQTETFTVTLGSPSGATIQDGDATGTITDDDGPVTTLPLLNIADDTVEEGDEAQFLVTLSRTSTETVTVNYATADGTATAGDDYTAASGNLTFAPGEASKTLRVPTVEDTTEEQTETFTVTLGNPSGATIQDGTAAGTITDDEPVTPLPTLTITDTEVKEGDMAEFLVTLRPASDETATVSFRTVDGTAVAGFDYTSTMGTLRFEPGETSATIAVSTLTDEIAEGAERFTLELSGPVGAKLADGTGSGTITDDHTARIRTVNRTILPEVGRALAFNAVTCRFNRPLSQPMAGNGTPRSAGRLSLSRALIADPRTSPASPPGQGTPPSDPWTSPPGPSLTLEQALGDSSFLMPSTTEQGGAGRYTAWGCADYRHLAGNGNGHLSWNGVAFSAQIGADVELGSNTLAGVSVSRSRSSFGYFGGGEDADRGGASELRLTGVNPYVAWSVTPDLDVWGTVGHAWGDYQIDDSLGAGSLRSAATLNSGTVGISGRLLARGGTMLRLRGEGGLAHLGVAGDGDTLDAVGLNMRRVRLSTEASYEHLFSFGSTLTPWAELGLRHDGGDGETGAGLEVRGGLRYRDLAQGLTIEGYGRRLVVHEGSVRESGFGLILRLDPGESGLGPSINLTPAWGPTASGVHQLWERGASAFSGYNTPGSRINAQFAYGFPALRGGGLLTPFGALSLAGEDGRGYGLGATVAVGRSATVSLEAERRRRRAGRAIYAVMLRGMLQF